MSSPAAVSPFTAVDEALATIEASGCELRSNEVMRSDLRWFASLQRAAEALSARWLAELERREPDKGSPDPQSCTEWLQEVLHVTGNTAYSQVRTARALDQLPRAYDALRHGRISGQHASVICRAMESLHETRLDPGETEDTLVTAASHLDPKELHRTWLQLRYRADQEAGLVAEEAQHKRRWLRLQQKWSGTFELAGELDPECGVMLRTALHGVLGRRSAGDDRTSDQRRHDGLKELVKRRLDSGELPERGGQKPHLLVVADVSTLRLEPGSKLAQLDWGPLVTGETARKHGCDAAITPVAVDGEGNVLYVGRQTRTVPAPVRKALNVRDQHCRAPGCTMPAVLCTPHHLIHWADGGQSILPNLRLYCEYHHGRLHPENDRYRTRPGPRPRDG